MANTAYFGELPMKSTQLAAADLSAAQFYAVTVGTSGVSLVASQGVGQVKILGNGPKAGEACVLYDLGETKVVAGAAITVGQLLMTDSSARMIPFVDNGVNIPVGEARLPASSAGDIFTALIWPTPGENGGNVTAIQDSITAHSGGGRTSAVALVPGWNRVSISAADTDSVVLPAAAAGTEVVVVNDAASHKCQVFGAGSDTIDAVAGATGVPLTQAKRAIFYCLTAGAWQSLMGAVSS